MDLAAARSFLAFDLKSHKSINNRCLVIYESLFKPGIIQI